MTETGQHDHREVNRRRLLIAIVITGIFLIVVIFGALLSGSLALLADAGHMLSDLIALLVALVATRIAARPATDRQTFGYQRAEVFGALINGVLLVVVVIYVAVAGFGRLIDPGAVEVQGIPMLLVGAAGLAANLASLLVLRGGAKTSINMRAAYLEVLGDLFGSVAAIIAAVIILTLGFQSADAIASLFIAAIIVPRAFSLLRDVVRVLSESVPADTSVAEIRGHILGTAGVIDVHDVHVWAITSGTPVFSAHVIVDRATFESGGAGRLLDELGACLADHFDVAHSTFQLEPAEHADHEDRHHD